MAGEFRFDPLTQQWTNIVGDRQARPNLPTAGCPFCVGGLEAVEPYDVRWFENRWPALSPGPAVDFDAAAGRQLPAVGAAEVILYSADHDASVSTLPPSQMRKVVELWAERTRALFDRDEVEYVLVFETRGADVGATIDHPHGQIYGYGFVPPVPKAEGEIARVHDCQVCDELRTELLDDTRIVYTSDTWVAYVPFASAYPYGMRLVPRAHVAGFPQLDDAQRDGLAAALPDVLGRYDRLWAGQATESLQHASAHASMSYCSWFHQAPKRHDGEYHLHAHFAPPQRAPGIARFVASGELGSGTLSNPVVPEDAAAALRAAGRES